MNTGEPCPPRASAGRRPSCVPHASPLPAAGPSDGAPGQVRSGQVRVQTQAISPDFTFLPGGPFSPSVPGEPYA